jgi:hypothetical protein
MGKICDPPSFTGGQCATQYELIWEATCVRPSGQTGTPPIGTNSRYKSYDMTYGKWYFPGPITSISPAYEYDDNGYGNWNWVFDISCANGAITRGSTIFATPENSNRNKNLWSQPRLISVLGSPNNCGDPPGGCRCSDDSCRVDCSTAPDGFCCIDHKIANAIASLLS